jgi:hypothetical protein
VQDATPAVMACGANFFKTQRGHDLDLILRYGAERIG